VLIVVEILHFGYARIVVWVQVNCIRWVVEED